MLVQCKRPRSELVLTVTVRRWYPGMVEVGKEMGSEGS